LFFFPAINSMSNNEGENVAYSIPELQKRYTERHKRRQEEKTLLKLIGEVKDQITQLQVEALDIKSRIRTTSSSKTGAGSTAKRQSQETEENDAVAETGGGGDDPMLAELDLSVPSHGNHSQVLDKMMRGSFIEPQEEEEEDDP